MVVEGYFYVEGFHYYYQQPLTEYQRKLYKSRDELVNALNKASCLLRIPSDNNMLEQIENDILKRNKGVDYPGWNWNTEFGNKCFPHEPPCECNDPALFQTAWNMPWGIGRQNPIGIEAVNYPAGSNSWIPVCHTDNSYVRKPDTVHLIVNPQAYACVSGFKECMTKYHNVITHEENWCLPPENKKPDNCGNGYIEKWECGRVRGKCGPDIIRVDMWTQLRKFAMENRSVFDEVEDYRISPFTISDNSYGGCGEYISEGNPYFSGDNHHLPGDTGYKFMSTCYSRVKPVKMCHSISGIDIDYILNNFQNGNKFY